MNGNLQLLIVGLIVLACVWRAFKRYLPKTAWRMQALVSFELKRAERPQWLRKLGLSLRPQEVANGEGCGSGCSSCGGCATKPAADIRPLHFAPRR